MYSDPFVYRRQVEDLCAYGAAEAIIDQYSL